jgi:hypothetical protein
MNPPFFNRWRDHLREAMAKLPDQRRGTNKSYAMEDFGLSAFAVFFTQSPSFLACQKAMREARGCDNAQSLFGISRIPTDNQIRQMLDPVPPEALHPLFDRVLDALRDEGLLKDFHGVHQSTLIALDGTGYRSSAKVHGPCCSHLTPEKGPRIYFHTALTPVLVAPARPEVFALRPEYITPQDGHEKQDCEIAAAKRWLQANFERYRRHGPVTLLGDDLYAHQPFCRQVLLHDGHFLFTAKPSSHLALYRWIERLEPGPDLRSLRERVRHKAETHTHTYRWANAVPLAEGVDALKVNWLELHVTNAQGETVYHNAWITDWKIDETHVASLAASARARWKIENENNNTLKTKGYHLEHNFGHGKKHLAAILTSLNLLAFLVHTALGWLDEPYRVLRARLSSRRTFFEHVRALTLYIHFPDWSGLLDFMMRGLELGPYAKKS